MFILLLTWLFTVVDLWSAAWSWSDDLRSIAPVFARVPAERCLWWSCEHILTTAATLSLPSQVCCGSLTDSTWRWQFADVSTQSQCDVLSKSEFNLVEIDGHKCVKPARYLNLTCTYAVILCQSTHIRICFFHYFYLCMFHALKWLLWHFNVLIFFLTVNWVKIRLQ